MRNDTYHWERCQTPVCASVWANKQLPTTKWERTRMTKNTPSGKIENSIFYFVSVVRIHSNSMIGGRSSERTNGNRKGAKNASEKKSSSRIHIHTTKEMQTFIFFGVPVAVRSYYTIFATLELVNSVFLRFARPDLNNVLSTLIKCDILLRKKT